MLRVRTPLPWRRIDAREVSDPVLTGSVAQAMQRLSSTAGAAGVLAVLGMEHTLALGGAPHLRLFATLTVALKDLPGPMPELRPGDGVTPIELNTAGGRYAGVRVRRVSESAIVPGAAPVSFLTIQYLVRTRYGVLASTFATPQPEIFDRLIPALHQIAAGVWLESQEQG